MDASTESAPEGALCSYLRDLGHHLPFASAGAERAAAQHLEAIEVELWVAILTDPQRLAVGAPLLSTLVPASPERHGLDLAPLLSAAERVGASRAQARVLAQRALHREADKVAADLRYHDVERRWADLVIAALPAPDRRDLVGLSRSAKQARAQFVLANLRLVYAIAKGYQRDGLGLEDLIQEGNMGLLKGLCRYDFRRGVKFSTYASWWIRHAVSRGEAEKGRTVRLPVGQIDLRAQLGRAERSLEKKLGRPAIAAELAAHLGLPIERIGDLRPLSFASLDDRGDSGEGRALYDELQAPGGSENLVEQLDWNRLCAVLPKVLRPFERLVLEERFVSNRTLKQIGDAHGLSRERVRQVESQALEKLRWEVRDRDLD